MEFDIPVTARSPLPEQPTQTHFWECPHTHVESLILLLSHQDNPSIVGITQGLQIATTITANRCGKCCLNSSLLHVSDKIVRSQSIHTLRLMLLAAISRGNSQTPHYVERDPASLSQYPVSGPKMSL
jgi:hypothetical protein